MLATCTPYENYESGLAIGICGSIQTAKSLGADKEKTKGLIMTQFSLSAEEADAYISKYWDLSATHVENNN